MPIYEYVCSDCNARFEAMRSMTKADDPIPCAHCNGMRTRRALSMFAAYSRGSGSGESQDSSSHSSGCGTCASHNCGSCHH